VIALAVSGTGRFVLGLVPTDLTALPETVHGTVHVVVALTSCLLGASGQLLLARRAEVASRRLLIAWVALATLGLRRRFATSAPTPVRGPTLVTTGGDIRPFSDQ